MRRLGLRSKRWPDEAIARLPRHADQRRAKRRRTSSPAWSPSRGWLQRWRSDPPNGGREYRARLYQNSAEVPKDNRVEEQRNGHRGSHLCRPGWRWRRKPSASAAILNSSGTSSARRASKRQPDFWSRSSTGRPTPSAPRPRMATAQVVVDVKSEIENPRNRFKNMEESSEPLRNNRNETNQHRAWQHGFGQPAGGHY